MIRIYLDIYNTINEHNHKAKSLPFIDSKIFCYLFLIQSKGSFITSFALSLIILSILSFLNALHALHHYLWKK